MLHLTDIRADYLAGCPPFATALNTTRRRLAGLAHERSIRRKSTIVHQESEWPFIAVVRKGRVFAIMGTEIGRDQILFEVVPNEIFGNLVLFDGGPTIARYATLDQPAELLLFPRAAVLRAAERDAHFAFALAASAVQQARAIAGIVHAHVAKKTIARVAATLMRYAPLQDGLASVDAEYLPSMRLTLVAAATGTVKEVVARAVADLERVGAIKRARGRIAYIDRGKLSSFT
jgi:CRP-like cAMP-binding protein